MIKQYTQAEIQAAIEWHQGVRYYKGYKCKAHNKSQYECKDESCTTFHRIEEAPTMQDSIDNVNFRIQQGINLTGYNSRPQDEWTC